MNFSVSDAPFRIETTVSGAYDSEIFTALTENRISIPFPQRNLQLVSSSVPFGGDREGYPTTRFSTRYLQ